MYRASRLGDSRVASRREALKEAEERKAAELEAKLEAKRQEALGWAGPPSASESASGRVGFEPIVFVVCFLLAYIYIYILYIYIYMYICFMALALMALRKSVDGRVPGLKPR